MEAAEAVLQFLASVGPGDQVEFYLRLFRSRPGPSFAVLAVDEHALAASLDSVAVDLRFLHALELSPCVALGLHGPAAAADAHAARLAARLAEDGVPTARAETAHGAAEVARIASSGAIPLLQVSGDAPTAKLEGLARLLDGLQTHKLIFLRQAGGLRDASGERVDVVSLDDEDGAMPDALDRSDVERLYLEQSRRLIFELVPHRLQIAMTSPLNLLHELFTVKGAGTLVRRAARVIRHDAYTDVDLAELSTLLASSFGRTPRPGFFERPVERVYLADGYRGVAIVSKADVGGYITKFAVTREAQGEGIGHDLWRELRTDYPSLSWRARRDNPVRAWYERICDGRIDVGEWTVFLWKVPTTRLQDAVAHALAQPIDLAESP